MVGVDPLTILNIKEVITVLDIHSHILPKFDDGSKSTEMSLQMLKSSAEQGVTTIVSTSHFYADSESPEQFLRRRHSARHRLESRLSGSEPDILYGAEVLYYPGISHSDEVSKLAIESTSLILIELPFTPWSESIFDELIAFQYNHKLNIVLAHVERYLDIQKRSIYRTMLDQPFLFQCNAEAFTMRRTRKLAMELMDNEMLHFLGTDCHNVTDRAPNMNKAQEVVEKRLSPRAWQALINNSSELFDRHKSDYSSGILDWYIL